MLQQLALIVAESLAEALSDALLAAGALSVSIPDADAGRPSERALFDEPGAAATPQAWPRNCLSVLLAADADPQLVVRAGARPLPIARPPLTELRGVEE